MSAPAEQRARALFPWLIVAGVAAVYVGLAWYALDGDGVAPAWTDEVFYVVSARSFAENGSLQDAVLIQESTARIWGAGSHGFVYTLLDGLAARATGRALQAKLGMNLTCVVAAIGMLVWRMRCESPGQLPNGILVLLLSFILPIYLFTFMQELIHLFVGVVVWSALTSVARATVRRRALLVLFGILLLASIARPNWILAVVGLLPLARTRREGLAYAILAAASVTIVAGTTRLFHAPFPSGFLTVALRAVEQEGWSSFVLRVVENTQINLGRYFDPGSSASASYTAAKYVYLALAGWLVIGGFRSSQRLALAVGVTAIVQWLALCLFYDAHYWRDQRALGPFMLLGGLALVTCWPGRPAALYLVVAAAVWLGGVWQRAVPLIAEHRQAAVACRENADQAAALTQLAGVISEVEPVTVLLPPSYLSDPTAMLALPVRSAGGGSIRYTVNRHGSAYARLGRVPVSYALLPPAAFYPASIELLRTPYYTLLRLPDRE